MSTPKSDGGARREATASRPALDPQARRSLKGLGNLIESITPWLLDVGSWIFGGLGAFSLVLIASLLTVGPVDAAILISITTLTLALPLEVAGVLLLRVVKDTKELGIDELALRAFQDAGFPNIEAYVPAPEERASLLKRRFRVSLHASAGIALLSLALTLAGLLAALWHMAWWSSAVVMAGVLLSTILVIVTVARSLPPESAAEIALKRSAKERRGQERVE